MNTIIRLWKVVFYRWALAEIDPMPPDVPHIAHRLAELEAAA